MNPNTDWLTPLAVIAAGLVIGAMVIYFNKKKPDLLSRLPPLRGFFAGVATTLAGVAIVHLALQPAAARATDDEVARRIELARAAVAKNDLAAVSEHTQFVLSRKPDDTRALTYEAVVHMSNGDTATAGKMLAKALKGDPNFLDAYVATAWVQTQEGRPADAEKTMQEAIRRHPSQKEMLDGVFAGMKSHPDTHADHSDHAAPAPAPDGKGIAVTLEVDAAARAGGGIVYVLARPAGDPKGFPVAVKRVELGLLPGTFELGAADSMTGQPIPATVRIEARLDRDGDIATKDPADPLAVQENVSPGSAVKLALK